MARSRSAFVNKVKRTVAMQGRGKVGRWACDLGKRGGVTGVACGTGVAHWSGMGVARQPSPTRNHARRCHLPRRPVRRAMYAPVMFPI